jgi:hypothetical protein
MKKDSALRAVSKLKESDRSRGTAMQSFDVFQMFSNGIQTEKAW